MSNPISALKFKAMAAAKSTATLPVAFVASGQPWIENPAPCSSCGSPIFWIDVYRGLHCAGCDPASAESLVLRRIRVVGLPGGLEWVTSQPERHRLGLESPAGADPDSDEVEQFTIERAGGPVRVTAERGRTQHGRRASSAGRYWPPRGQCPVGDMTLDEWFESLPELQDPKPKE